MWQALLKWLLARTWDEDEDFIRRVRQLTREPPPGEDEAKERIWSRLTRLMEENAINN